MMITNLLTNMIVLALHGNFIPTNSPAFQQYAFHVMYTNAQSLGARWHLDQSVVSSNNVTRFDARAYPKRMHASIDFGERYRFSTSATEFFDFSDIHFRETTLYPEWVTNQALFDRYGGDLKQLLAATNFLTLPSAQKIAESALSAAGVPAAELGFLQPKRKEQLKLGNKLLPYYKFEWRTERASCKVHVSGIITNIVHFEFEGPESLRFKSPPNYLQLLGLPTNTIFVKPVSPGVYKLLQE